MLQLACLAVLLLVQLPQQHVALAADLPTQAAKPSIIAVGDGLTEGAFARKHDGWGVLLQERYVRKADVINRGFGGYFTSWIVDYMLDDLFNVANPTMAILFLGTKDTLTQAVSGNHYIPPQQFGVNVEKIIMKAKASGVKHCLIISPPPVCDSCKNGKPKPWDRENSHSRMYVQQLKSLAAKHKAGFLNIFEEWQKDPSWASKLLQPDMLHLSSEGNKLLFQQIQAAITEQVPAMAWENVALHYPLMDAIDKDHPGTAFEKVQKVQTKRKMAQDSAGVSAYIKGATSHSSSSSSGLIWEHGQLKSSAHHVAAVSVWWLLLGIVTWHLANLC